MRSVIVALIGSSLAVAAVRADTYEVDPSHTEIGFAVRHMLVSNVRGSFSDLSGSFDYNPDDLSTLNASALIKVESIDTRNEKRDEHLRSPDFFDAKQFPEITFKVTRADANGGDPILYGDLTMKGVTKEIAIPVTMHGPITDPWGNVRAGFEGSVTINRQDWGISWSKSMDGGGLVVSDEVKIELSVEGVKKKE